MIKQAKNEPMPSGTNRHRKTCGRGNALKANLISCIF